MDTFTPPAFGTPSPIRPRDDSLPRFPTALDYSDAQGPSAELTRLGEALKHKDNMLTLAENLRKSLEKDLESLSKSSAAQQKQILSYTQLLREKEALIERLESGESALRKELAEAGKRLREAETQASLVGQLRQDMTQSKAIMQAVEAKIQSLEEDRSQLAAETKAQRSLIDELKRKAKTSDLKAYIEHMQAQSEETTRLFQKTRETQLHIERKMTESEKRNSALRRSVKQLFDQLCDWTSSFCQPSTAPVPLLTLPEWPDLQSAAESYFEVLENTKEALVKRLQRDEIEKKELRVRLDFFEKGTSELKGQLERLGKQVERQEKAGKVAVQDRESREKHWELKQIRSKAKLKALRDAVKSQKSDLERFESSVQPLLGAAGKLGFSGAGKSGFSLETAADCVYYLLAQVEQREAARVATVQALTAAQDALTEAQSYKAQAQDLSVQLQSLGVSLGQAEVKVRRCDQLLTQVRELEAANAQLSAQVRNEKDRKEAASALLDSALQAVTRLKGNYCRLKSLARVYDKTLQASGKTLAEALDQSYPSFSSPVSRLRAAVIAVMASKRLRKSVTEGSMDYRYLGLKLVVANTGLDRGFIRELLARATGRYAECLGSLFPKRMSSSKGAVAVLAGGVYEKLQQLQELNNQRGKEIAIKEEKALRLERNIQELTSKFSDLSKTHENCPPPAVYAALQQDQEDLRGLVLLQQGRLEELEKDSSVMADRLRETVLELQQQARLAGEQLAEAGKEGRLKDKHIESLEGIVTRLERTS